MSNAKTNATASTSICVMCELPQHICKHQHKTWKIFHFLALAFYTCEPGQRKDKRKMKNTGSMPLWITFKPRWHPPPPSLILLPESLFPDYWSRVTRTMGTRLLPSWDTEICMRISFCTCASVLVANVNQPLLSTCNSQRNELFLAAYSIWPTNEDTG